MGTGKMTRRAAALLLALALAAGLFPAALAEQPAAPAAMDVDLIMAKNAIAGFGIQGADGKTMEPRRAPDMRGRGLPDETGVEPDYRGVVGYASLQADWAPKSRSPSRGTLRFSGTTSSEPFLPS